jgi:hypothetical protein
MPRDRDKDEREAKGATGDDKWWQSPDSAVTPDPSTIGQKDAEEAADDTPLPPPK